MIVKTHAVALQVRPFSETSHIVTWLSRDHGKINTIVKGAQRPRNHFLGQYDLFYTCELVFYLRLFQGLHVVKECFPLETRSNLRRCWPGAVCASYCCGLAAGAAPFYAAQQSLYALLEHALDFFTAGVPLRMLETALVWFELRLLDTLGYAPRLKSCLLCRRPAESGRGPVFFSAERGGIICGQCARNGGEESGAMSPDSFALLKYWQAAAGIEAVRNVICSERQLEDAEGIVGRFMQRHLESENTGRDIAFSLLKPLRHPARRPPDAARPVSP